jgi:hypothetical protein
MSIDVDDSAEQRPEPCTEAWCCCFSEVSISRLGARFLVHERQCSASFLLRPIGSELKWWCGRGSAHVVVSVFKSSKVFYGFSAHCFSLPSSSEKILDLKDSSLCCNVVSRVPLGVTHPA